MADIFVGALVFFSVQIFAFIIAISVLYIYRLLKKGEREPRTITFSEKLTKLTDNLATSSKEFDHVLEEMNKIANERKFALTNLDVQIAELSKKETEMKKKVDELEKVSIPALEYLLQETEKSEKRSANRDYLLFFAGMVFSTVISIVLRIFGI